MALLLATTRLAGAASAAPVQGPHAELVTTGDVVIETLVQGQGPAIVILPSIGRDSREDYDEAAQRLAGAGFKVLRPQPRGIGRSTGPMNDLTLNDFAQDVAHVVEALGNGRAVWVGHAFGHFVARAAAVRHPDRVRGVVLAAASASDTAQRYPQVYQAPGIAGDPGRPTAERLAALRFAFFAPGHDPSAWLNGWYPQVAEVQRKGMLPQSQWWAAGRAPLLELIPEEDPFKPRDRWAELKTQYGDRVTAVTIPRASHALFPEQPDAVAIAIINWTRKLPD